MSDRALYNAFRGFAKALAELEQHNYLMKNDPEYKARVEAHDKAIEEKRQADIVAAADRNAEELSYRLEVIEAICKTGIARHVATEMTNSDDKLDRMAIKYGVA